MKLKLMTQDGCKVAHFIETVSKSEMCESCLDSSDNFIVNTLLYKQSGTGTAYLVRRKKEGDYLPFISYLNG